MNVGYPASRLTFPDRSRRHPRPGERVPDMPVVAADGPSSLFRVLRRGGHVLVVKGAGADCARDGMAGMPYRDLAQIVTVAADGTSDPRRDGTPMVYLVRPDGYLTARGTPGKLGSIHDYLRALAPDAATARPATSLPALTHADRPLPQAVRRRDRGPSKAR